MLSKESRKQWEKQFCALYVQPILNNMDSRLNTAQNLFVNDDRQGMIFTSVYIFTHLQ